MEQRTIEQRLDSIERYAMLGSKNILTVDEAATMLDMKTANIYTLTSQHKIPFYKPNGKKIYFLKDELEKWVLSNRVSTDEEISQKARTHNIKTTKHNVHGNTKN